MQYLSLNIHKFSQVALFSLWLRKGIVFKVSLKKKNQSLFFRISKLGNFSHQLGIKDIFLH